MLRVLKPHLKPYIVAILTVAIALGLTLLLNPLLSPTITPLFFAAVMISVWYEGMQAGLVAALLSTLALNFFFTEPIYQFRINNLGELVRLGVFILVTLLISSLNAQLRTAKKQVEKSLVKLQESEQRYRQIVETANEGIWTINAEGRTHYVNQRLAEMFGYSIAEMLDRSLFDFMDSEAQTLAKQHFQQWQKGVPAQFDFRYRRRDGSDLWAIVASNPILGERGEFQGAIAMLTDVTDRKQAEVALQASEQRYRELFENANDVIYTLDLAGNLTSLNKSGERITGYTCEELLHQPISQIVVPEFWQTMVKMFDRKVAGEPLTTYELEILTKDQRRLTLEVSSKLIYQAGHPAGMQGIARDISDRKRAEATLRESEWRLRQLLNSQLLGIIYADFQGNIIEANDAWLNILGYTREEVLSGKVNFVEITPPEYRHLDQQAVAEMKRTGSHTPFEKEYIRKDGTRVPVLVGTAYLGTANEVGVGFLIDLTERKQAQASLKKLTNQVQAQADTLNAILSASVDHIYIIDRVGRYKYVSEGGAAVLGFTPTEIMGKTWQELGLPPEVMTAFDAQREEAIACGQPIKRETNFLDRYYEYIIAPLWNQEQRIETLVIVSRDITERQQTAEALRASQEQLQLAFDAANLGMWDWNLQTGQIIWSGQHERLFGMEPGTFRGTYAEFRERVHPDDIAWVEERLHRCRAEKIDYEAEHRVIWTDGSIRWLVSKGKFLYDEQEQPFRMIGTVTDITRRKHIEDALRLSETRFRTLVEQSPLSIQILAPTGETLQVNRAWEELWGVTLDQIPEYNVLEDQQLVAKGVMPYIQQAFAGQGGVIPPINYDPNETIPDRSIHQEPQRWVSAFIYPLKDEQGKIREVVLVHEDITPRIRAEEALRFSEAKFRRLADSNIIGVITVDINGSLLEANDAFLEMVGYTQEELVAGRLDWKAMTPAEYQVQDEQAIEQLYQTGICTPFEKEYIRKDGSRVPILLGAALLEGSQNLTICFVVDLSDRKRVEEVLRKREDELRLITNAVPVLISYVDRNQRYRFNNKHYETWFKKPPEEVYNQSIEEVLGASAYETLRPYIETVLSGQSVTFESEIYYESIGTRYILATYIPQFGAQGQVEGFVTLISDISDRKRAEIALAETNQTLQALIRACPLAITVFDFEGIVKLWNPAAEQIFGWSEQEALGQFIPSVPENKRAEFNQNLNLVNLQQPVIGLEATRQRKDGSLIDVALWAASLQDAKGNPSCMSIIADITQRKQLEAERAQLLVREQAARADAEAANRMKDEFLATLSHELRTPLNAMLGWTQLLRTRQFDAATTARALETIDRNTKSLSQLIEDVLDVSRIITGKLRLNVQPLELIPVVEAAIDTVKPAAEAKGIEIKSLLSTSVGKVLGDANRLQQIIWNLLSNAVKFTPKGGQVEIQILEEYHPLAATPFVQIRVTDTGKGIPVSFLPYVFERFRQADSSITRSYGGLGLGLAIVRHLAELHGGTVQADSLGEGQGATFTVELPLLEANRKANALPEKLANLVIEEKTEAEASRFLTPQLLNGLQILVVDDEADARELMIMVLEQYGAEVIAVASASEALEALQRLKPNILISDIGLPEEDGYTLIRKVRALDSGEGGRIPAVALTAYARTEDRTQAILAGFQLHVPKPVNPDELAAVVANLTGRIQSK